MIFLKWEEPVEPNGLITQYEVGEIKRPENNWWQLLLLATEESSANAHILG